MQTGTIVVPGALALLLLGAKAVGRWWKKRKPSLHLEPGRFEITWRVRR